MMVLIFTSQASEELNYSPTWLKRQVLQSHSHTISYDAKHVS